jgi:hypothetical protein
MKLLTAIEIYNNSDIKGTNYCETFGGRGYITNDPVLLDAIQNGIKDGNVGVEITPLEGGE